MQLKAVIDRFEANKAVILVGDDEQAVTWPRKALPEEAKEGDIIRFSINIDADATRTARSEADELLRQILTKNQED